MGLVTYLEAERYFSVLGDCGAQYAALTAAVGIAGDAEMGSVRVAVHVGYWWQAWHVMAWFRAHVPAESGERKRVTAEQLAALRAACLEELADAECPTESVAHAQYTVALVDRLSQIDGEVRFYVTRA